MINIFIFFCFPCLISSLTCFVNSTIAGYCRSCSSTYYYNFNVSSPNAEFPSTSCLSLKTSTPPTLKIYVSNSTNNCSSCNGTIQNPYNNLIKAFIATWKASVSYSNNNLTFYLIGTTHFINKYDWGSQETIQIFRRFYANITILPLSCKDFNISGCFSPNDTIKPTIYLKTDQFSIFVVSNLSLINVTFDGRDMHMANFTTNDSLYTTICQFNDLNQTYIENSANNLTQNCSLRNRTILTSNGSYSLFYLEYFIEKTSSNTPSINLYDCDFNLINSFNSANNGYVSLIGASVWSHNLNFYRTSFEYFHMPNGVYNSKINDTYYFPCFSSNYSVANSIAYYDYTNKVSFKIYNCSFKYFNYFKMVEKLYSFDLMSLFLMRGNPFFMTFQNNTFQYNFFPYDFSYKAALFRFYNPYNSYGSKNYLNFYQNLFELNFYPYHFYDDNNMTLATTIYIYFNSTRNTFSKSSYNFAFLLNANISTINDTFQNWHYVSNFFILNMSNVYLQNTTFLNFDCPFDNKLSQNVISDNLEYNARFFKYLSIQPKTLDAIFNPKTSQAYYTDYEIFIDNSNFINFNCSLLKANQEIFNYIFINRSNFSNIYIDSSIPTPDFMNFYTEVSFNLSFNVFQNINTSSVIFQMIHGRSVAFLNNKFYNLSASIFQTTFRTINPKNGILFLMYNCEFVNISASNDIFFQDKIDVSSAYCGNFSNLTFKNIVSLSDSSIIALNFYMENINFTNVTFLDMRLIRCIFFTCPLSTQSYSITSFKCSNVSFAINNNNYVLGSFIEVVEFANITLIFSNFSGNSKVNQEKAFVILQTVYGIIKILNCNFFGLKGSQVGSLYVAIDHVSNILIANCSFKGNVANFMSDIYFSFNVKVSNFKSMIQQALMQNNLISNKTNYTECILQFQQSLECVNSTNFTSFQRLFGLIDNKFTTILGYMGGSISFDQNSQFFMRNNIFDEVSTYISGGLLYSNINSEIFILRINVSYGFAVAFGGCFFGKSIEISIESSIFSNNEASKGGLMYGSYSTITLYNLTISQSSANMGGIFFLDNCDLNVTKTLFKYAYASTGGHLYISKSTIFVGDCLFDSGVSDFQSGSLFLENNKNFTFDNVTISNCFTNNKAIVYVSGMNDTLGVFRRLNFFNNSGQYSFYLKNGRMLIFDSDFTQLTAENGFQGISSLKQGFLFFNSCKFHDIKSKQSMFLLSGFGFSCRFCLFYNLSQCQTYIIDLSLSNLTLKYTIFDIYYIMTSLRYIQTEACIRGSNSNINVSGTLFYGQGLMGALMGLNSLNNVFNNVSFLACFPLLYGGSISLSNTEMLILEECLIYFSKSSTNGGGIYLEDTNASIASTKFIECKALSLGSAIFATKNKDIFWKELLLYDVDFINNSGIGLYLMKINNVTMINIVSIIIEGLVYSFSTSLGSFLQVANIEMTNLTINSSYGVSAVQITTDEDKTTDIIVTNSTFSGCFSQTDGAVFSLSGSVIFTINGSSFLNNTSNKNGGVLYFSNAVGTCYLEIDSSKFINNSASFYGGVMQFQKLISVSIHPNTIFLNNKATAGPVYCSIPIYSFIFPLESNENTIKSLLDSLNLDTSLNATEYYFKSIISGDVLNFSVGIFDSFLNFASLEQEAYIELTSEQSDSNTTQKLELYNNRATVRNGLAYFSSLQFIGQPGINYNVSMTYQSLISQDTYSQKIRVPLRLCRRGEEFVHSQCFYCKKKYYSLHNYTFNDSTDGFLCQPCAAHATCLGYDSLIPDEGYWRFNRDTVYIAKCKILEACPIQTNMLNLGDTEEAYGNFYYRYNCSVGYEGNLCSQCQISYGKNTDQKCVKCAQSIWLFIRFALISMAVMLFLVVQAMTALNFGPLNSQKRSFLKIIVDHFAFVSFISRFNIDWGTVLTQYFEISDKFVTTAPEEIFNFNCFLALIFDDVEFIEWINMILISLSPIIFIFLVLSTLYAKIWVMVFYKTRKEKDGTKESPGFMNNLLSVFLVVFYNFYPRLILSAFFLFKCITINDSTDSFLEQNPDIMCWDRKHISLILFLGLPNIVIWGFGIPILLSLMALKFKLLMDLTSKFKHWNDILNYLTIDYKASKYYWETFLFLQKLVVVAVSIFTSRLDAVSQGGIMILVFLVFFLIYEASSPSQYEIVNKYRVFSYMTTICTAAFAILSSNEENTTTMKLLYLSCMLGSNTVFYFGWLIHFAKLQLLSFQEGFKSLANFVKSRSRKNKTKKASYTTILNPSHSQEPTSLKVGNQ